MRLISSWRVTAANKVVRADLFLFEERAVGAVSVDDLDPWKLRADLLGDGEGRFR